MINPNGSIFSAIAIFDALSLVMEVNANTIIAERSISIHHSNC